jgi:hypothetical protein
LPEETMSNEEYSHYLHNDVNALKGLKGEKEDVSMYGEPNVVKEALQNDLDYLLDEIIQDVSPTGTPDPRAIMNKALAGLSKVEAKSFVLQNLLEAIKKGIGSESINVTTILQGYNRLGLTTIDLGFPVETKILQYEADGANIEGFGKFIRGLLKKVFKIALTLIEIIKNAVKKVFGSVGIKPIIGVTGVFPSLSFQLEVENLTSAEFFEVLRASI